METIAEALIAEGEARGEAEGLRKSLRRIFAYMFGVELDHFDEPLQSLDTPALEQVNETVFELENLAKLEALLDELRPTPEDEA